jgi:hypothetical protein
MDLKRTCAIACMFFIFGLGIGLRTPFATDCAPKRRIRIRSIAGMVVDISGYPIPEAQVEVLKTKDDIIGRTLTDKGGKFELRGIPAGKYSLRVDKSGFSGAWQPIELRRPQDPSHYKKSLRVYLPMSSGCSAIYLSKK